MGQSLPSKVVIMLPMLCYCREMERREKVEEARRETERILAEQEAEVARRKVCGGSRCCDSHVLQQMPAMPHKWLATAKGGHVVSARAQ